jgi:hypothetical protein
LNRERKCGISYNDLLKPKMAQWNPSLIIYVNTFTSRSFRFRFQTLQQSKKWSPPGINQWHIKRYHYTRLFGHSTAMKLSLSLRRRPSTGCYRMVHVHKDGNKTAKNQKFISGKDQRLFSWGAFGTRSIYLLHIVCTMILWSIINDQNAQHCGRRSNASIISISHKRERERERERETAG